MPAPLQLRISDFQDETHWRWTLHDAGGRFLGDHEVALDTAVPEYRGFVSLADYLDFYQPVRPPAEQLRTLGAWIGEQVFGGLRTALLAAHQPPATPVEVQIPPAAAALLLRPFELARLEGPTGPALTELGLRLVYRLADTPEGTRAKTAAEETLRVLAVFSLPDKVNPLNLRRERYQLQQLVQNLRQAQGKAVELRIVQYGATRETLREVLEEAPGWDLVHLSGHGTKGELQLETAAGHIDRIRADELAALLRPIQARLKLLILDACDSGAASHAAARAQVGLDPAREADGPTAAAAPETSPTAAAQLAAEESATAVQTVLPSLAQDLVAALDCAALAMRYPVGDTFATELMLALYEKLLGSGQPLPAALHLALRVALARDSSPLPQAAATPILFGPRAGDLRLAPPELPIGGIVLPQTGLIYFPPEPPRFVGRIGPLLRASLALAPESAQRGVLFYGMAGAGKSACALELAYRHERGRFRGQVWYRAPEEGSDIATALSGLMLEIERQLNAPTLRLAAHLDEPERFRTRILPRLRALLEQHALLLVLDNLESLLTSRDQWRDPLWGEVLSTLLGHRGRSRVVLTSRRLPADLAGHPHLQREAVHALSFAESVLLARELPHLGRLFADPEDRRLLRRTLRLVQGHPKLLELADGLAADRDKLAQQVAAGEAPASGRAAELDAFFAAGDSATEGETRQGEADFVATLHRWTDDVAAGLSPAARLLLTFLARLEPEDRTQAVLEANWKDFLTRIQDQHADAQAALGESDLGRTSARGALVTAGLLEVTAPDIAPETVAQIEALLAQQEETELDAGQILAALAAQGTTLQVHPGVAEAVRAAADSGLLDAADVELGNYHIAMSHQGREQEHAGGGAQVVDAGRRGEPYLLRQRRWADASALLEQLLFRDQRPETLAFALPLLERIAAETQGTARGLIDAGLVAKALSLAGRAEAEQALRRVIDDAVVAKDFRTASTRASDLLNLLRDTGRLRPALAVADEKARYRRETGAGPWTRVLDECQRLQVLSAMGRYEAVLARVEALRRGLADLPEPGEDDGAVNPFNVREVLLDTGRSAALGAERWDEALALNAEQIRVMERRGADALDLGRARFNDYFPLLRQGRLDDCRVLLLDCRAVFEAERSIEGLGKVYSALAGLQDEAGDYRGAADFEAIALRFKYQTGQPEACAVSHHNLANYMNRGAGAPEVELAHRLADVALCIQIGSGGLTVSIHNLAQSELPAAPPSFEQVAARVEQVEGVRFRDLFAALPGPHTDGDAAIAAVWEQVLAERGHSAREAANRRAVLDTLPPALAEAVENGDQQAIEQAFAELSADEQTAALATLREAGLLPDEPDDGPDPDAARAVLDALPPTLAEAFENGDQQAIEQAFAGLSADEQHAALATLREAGLLPDEPDADPGP